MRRCSGEVQITVPILPENARKRELSGMTEGAINLGDLRLFYACPLPPAALDALQHIQDTARRAGWRGRFTDRSGWHITLVFLGTTAPERLPGLERAGAAAVREAGPLSLRLKGLAALPSSHKVPPRVLVVELDDPLQRLERLRQGLLEALSLKDTRPYRPHVTIVRLAQDATQPALPHIAPSALRVVKLDQLVLYESHLLPDAARYQIRGAWTFSA